MGGSSIAVGGGIAVGGVAYSGAYVAPQCDSSSSFSFSLFVGGGWGGIGFAYSDGCWWSPPCYGWSACGGWAPFCGWAWSPGGCGWNGWCGWGGWGGWCARPFWCPPVWGDPWCAPVGWSSCWAPGFSLCFGWDAWSTSWLYSPVVFQPPPPQIVVVQPPQVVLASSTQAWGLLGAGFDSAAMEQFAALLSAQPADPGNLVGYALSQAMMGMDASAVTAMRQATRDRAESLLLVPTDPNLRDRLLMLAQHLQDRIRSTPGSASTREDLFLLASVQTILYDNANAYFSISSAIDQGDRDPAAFNIKALLTARLGP